MPEHSLEFSKQVISDLAKLGEELGYHVETEMPVVIGNPNPPAVDVAWFAEKEQAFPLMIFEVESRPTSSIANNPVKVFGQTNQSFEKLLFYFHVIVKGGEDTSRVAALERLFGTYNYRVYKLEENQSTQLVKDILSQHRRLGQNIDLRLLVPVLEASSWKSLDIDSLVLYVEQIGFERGMGTFLPRYAWLARSRPTFIEHFTRYLIARYDVPANNREVDKYETYFGSYWNVPIQFGIIISTVAFGEKERYFNLLREWQESSSIMSQIGPHFGLDREYDRFIFGLAGPLLALIAALLRDLPRAVVYVAFQCKVLLTELESAPISLSFLLALWMLHISSSVNEAQDLFDFARSFINERGGISKNMLSQPPSGFSDITQEGDLFSEMPREDVPDFDTFRTQFSQNYQDNEQRRLESIKLAIKVLIEEEAWLGWSPKLVRILH